MPPAVQELINEANQLHAANRTFSVTGPDAGQCTAIPHRLAQLTGNPIVYGNAKDTLANAPDANYTKVTNAPDNFPPPGAIVVWNGSWGGGYGHTAVAVDGCTTSVLRVLEENDGDGGLPHIGTHDYSGVIGWYIPKNLQPVTVDTPAADNEGVVNGQGLRGHTQPSSTSPYPWTFDDNEHITLLAKTQAENVTAGPYAPSNWWYLAHGNDANAKAAGSPQVWVSDAFIRTTHNPASVPDYQVPGPPATPPTPAPVTGRVLYDSTSASDIPADAPVVGGYVDGKYAWSDADWARFPGDKVKIAVFASTDDGHVLDVENGDATPDQAPAWAHLRRASGVSPTCYVNRGNWQAVKDAFTAAGEPQPDYWVSTLDGTKLDLGNGVVACQYAGEALSGGHYDLSTVIDGWPTHNTTTQPLPVPVVVTPPAITTPAPDVNKKGEPMQLSKYNKALVALAGLVLTVINLIAGNNHYVELFISLLTVIGVHQVPNLEDGVKEVVDDVKSA